MSSQNNSIQSGSVVFSVTWWRLMLRILTLLIMVALNYALLGSMFTHWQTAADSLRTDLLSLLVLLFFNVTVLLPGLLQASVVEVSPEGLLVKALLWKSKFNWLDINSFSRPAAAGFAIIRGKKRLYLLAKRDFANFEELVRIISARVQH